MTVLSIDTIVETIFDVPSKDAENDINSSYPITETQKKPGFFSWLFAKKAKPLNSDHGPKTMNAIKKDLKNLGFDDERVEALTESVIYLAEQHIRMAVGKRAIETREIAFGNLSVCKNMPLGLKMDDPSYLSKDFFSALREDFRENLQIFVRQHPEFLIVTPSDSSFPRMQR